MVGRLGSLGIISALWCRFLTVGLVVAVVGGGVVVVVSGHHGLQNEKMHGFQQLE